MDTVLAPRPIVAGKHLIDGTRTTILAEIGNNHCGEYILARHLITRAKAAGADGVKLQIRDINRVFTKDMREKPHGVREAYGKNYGEYRQALELSLDEHRELKKHAESLGLFYFVTPFDEYSLDMLEELGVDLYKVSSFDNRNTELLREIARKGKPVIMSTGMCSEEELDRAVGILSETAPALALLHCISEYPTTPEHANLSLVSYLVKRYPDCIIGYSGHETGIALSLAALTLGARIVERHFTCDKTLPGPDHGTVSVDFAELKALVDGARTIEVALGEPVKRVYDFELRARLKHSKSLTSACTIPEGATITTTMLVCKSPGGDTEKMIEGISPHRRELIVGKRVKHTIPEDTTLFDTDIEW